MSESYMAIHISLVITEIKMKGSRNHARSRPLNTAQRAVTLMSTKWWSNFECTLQGNEADPPLPAVTHTHLQ